MSHRYQPYPSSRSSSSSTSTNRNNNNSSGKTTSNFEVRDNSSGYRQYRVVRSSSNTNSPKGQWQYTHRRVAEKKIGREILPTEHVHHINKNKQDNRRENLAVLDEYIHQHLHSDQRLEKTACFRCGHTSHHSSQCFARNDVFGRDIIGNGSRTIYRENQFSLESSSSDDDDSDSSSCSYGGGCSRCGRGSHSASNCYARTDVYGNRL